MGQRTRYHAGVFFLTYMASALYHVVRRTRSHVQSSLIAEWTPAPTYRTQDNVSTLHHYLFSDRQNAEVFLGLLNSIFSFVFGVSFIFSGMIAERVDRRLFLTTGMALSSLVVFISGPVLEWTGSYSRGAYITLEILNALFQSTSWPCLVPFIANWFSKKSRGYVLGLWTSSASVGSIVGAILVAEVVGFGYEFGFVVTCSVMLAGAVLIFFGLVPTPGEVGLTVSVDDCRQHGNDKSDADNGNCEDQEEKQTLLRKGRKNQGKHVTYASYDHGSGAIRIARTVDTNCSLADGKCRSNCSQDRAIPETPKFGQKQSQSFPLDSIPESQSAIRHNHSYFEDVGEDYGHNEDSSFLTKDQMDSDFTTDATGDNTRLCEDASHSNAGSYIHANEELTNDNVVDLAEASTVTNDLQQHKTYKKPAKQDTERNSPAIGLFGALLLPGVIPYALCLSFLNMGKYVFYFWLPYYLASSYGWTESTADRLSFWYDIGGIVGASACTYFMNRLNKSALIFAPMLLASIPLLYVYGVLQLGQELATNAALLFCLGSLLNGVAGPLSAVVSADLGRQEVLQRSPKSMSTIVGILEGSGTLGAAVGQIAVPYMKAALGWNSVYYFLMITSFLSALALLNTLCTEAKKKKNRKRNSVPSS